MFLYLTEFFAGMSVMAVELGASRLLAPYFSSSQIVWTIIIGTIMIAMALGNLYGGRMADKKPDPSSLYRRIIIAAIWIAAIPVLGKYVIVGVAGIMVVTVNTGFLIWAAFAACMVVFVFPLFLLGTVTPCLVKYAVQNLADSGSTVGKLNASNTVGSIIGTFVPTFVTIPSVGTSITFIIFSCILMALAVVFFIGQTGKKDKVLSAVGVVIIILCAVFGHRSDFAFWEKGLTYEGESVYNYLQVSEDDQAVYLSTNVMIGIQSVYVKNGSLTGMYYDYAMAAPFMNGVHEKNEVNTLILGMGTGTFATQCDRYFDNVNSKGVEIDGKIIDLSRRYFGLSESTEVVEYDGRAYLSAISDKYDVIMVDAYQDITIPFQMSSVEFFTLVKEHLAEGGVMVVNMNMRGTGELSGDDDINVWLKDTIAAVFPYVYTADVINGSNCELFASCNPGMLDIFERNVEAEQDHSLKRMMQTVGEGLKKYEAGNRVMTDDQAPVELLGMKIIDTLIMDELQYYKQILKEKGIRGLLDEIM